jgi:acylphosphatase
MKKCLKIVLQGDFSSNFLKTTVLKHARAHDLEGIARITGAGQVTIVVCGIKAHVDEFLDGVHKHEVAWEVQHIEVEPFLKDKDYRGVFRIIE